MDLHIEGQFNVIVARGPFNRELVIAGDKAQEELDSGLQASGRWGTMLVFKDSALATLEALEEITSILKARVARGIKPVAVAIVLGQDVEGARLMQAHYVNAYANADINVRAFDSEESAVSWLKSELQPASL